MPYVLDFDQTAQDQIAALPHDAAVALAEVWTFLQLTPWNGPPLNWAHPDGAVRTIDLGKAAWSPT